MKNYKEESVYIILHVINTVNQSNSRNINVRKVYIDESFENVIAWFNRQEEFYRWLRWTRCKAFKKNILGLVFVINFTEKSTRRIGKLI